MGVRRDAVAREARWGRWQSLNPDLQAHIRIKWQRQLAVAIPLLEVARREIARASGGDASLAAEKESSSEEGERVI
jgi:hypothetical protein